MNDKREMKKLLIYLYENFNGSQDLIMDELLVRNLHPDKAFVNEYLKSNGIKVTDYIAFFETKFPAEFKKVETPILIIHKKNDKTCRRFLNYKLQDDGTDRGGISFEGETLRDFLDECEIVYSTPIREVNQYLQENGIKPIIW